jgi:hypothetical protein
VTRSGRRPRSPGPTPAFLENRSVAGRTGPAPTPAPRLIGPAHASGSSRGLGPDRSGPYSCPTPGWALRTPPAVSRGLGPDGSGPYTCPAPLRASTAGLTTRPASRSRAAPRRRRRRSRRRSRPPA